MLELSAPPGIVSADASIEIDGEVQTELNGALVSIIVEETTAGLCRCEARFGNWSGSVEDGYPYLDREITGLWQKYHGYDGCWRRRRRNFQGVDQRLRRPIQRHRASFDYDSG